MGRLGGDKPKQKGIKVNSAGSKHRAVNMPPAMNTEFSELLEILEDREGVNPDKVNSNVVLKLMVSYCVKSQHFEKFAASHLKGQSF